VRGAASCVASRTLFMNGGSSNQGVGIAGEASGADNGRRAEPGLPLGGGGSADPELERGITLVQACWAVFDGVAARVSPEMRRSRAEEDATATRSSSTPSAPKARTSRSRSGYGYRRARSSPRMDCGSIARPTSRRCAYNAGKVKRRMRSWTLPFLIRHSAYHTLDHAWEMEDKDLPATVQ
jgi:hypothetical protein